MPERGKEEHETSGDANSYPSPWRWGDDPGIRLLDSNGKNVVSCDGFAVWGHGYSYVPSYGSAPPPVVRELIRIAPEMEALLRRALVDLKTLDLAEGGACGPAYSRCDVEALLSALDAARGPR